MRATLSLNEILDGACCGEFFLATGVLLVLSLSDFFPFQQTRQRA